MSEVSVGLETKAWCNIPCAVYGAHFGTKCCSEDHLALVADVAESDPSALG